MVCGACGAHLYAPEDACCLYCGGGELRELGQRALICRMDARTGEVDCTEEEAHGTL